MNEKELFSKLTERLDKLEKKNSRLRKINIVLFLFILGLPILSFQAANQFFKVIETEKLVLKDKNGKERAVLFMDEDYVKFRLKNSKDSVMAMIGADEEGGYININGVFEDEILKNGKEICNLLLTSNLGVMSKNNERVFGWGLNDIGDSYLVVGEDEKRSTEIYKGLIQIKDKDGINRIVMNAENYNNNNNSEIIIRSNSKDYLSLDYGRGIGRICLLNGPELNGIYLYDEQSKVRNAIGKTKTKNNKGQTVYHPESSIWLFDEKGNGVFNAPNN